MNMSLSVERAEQLNINVKHVFVADDCAPNARSLAGRRAACGIVLLAKVILLFVAFFFLLQLNPRTSCP